MDSIFIANPELDRDELIESASDLIEKADSLLALHCPGVSGHVDLSKQTPAIAGQFTDSVRTLLAGADCLLQASEAKSRKKSA